MWVASVARTTGPMIAVLSLLHDAPLHITTFQACQFVNKKTGLFSCTIILSHDSSHDYGNYVPLVSTVHAQYYKLALCYLD